LTNTPAAKYSTSVVLVTIKQDKKGMLPEHLTAQLAKGGIRLIYLTPLHQYPTTATLDVRRRIQIYQLAAQYGVAIINNKVFRLVLDFPAGDMALWVDMDVSVAGLKQTLLAEDVYLQTEVEFNLITQQDNSKYRFIRIGFASMNEIEITQGMKIIMHELYGQHNLCFISR